MNIAHKFTGVPTGPSEEIYDPREDSIRGAAEAIGERLGSRETVDARAQVSDWLDIAADGQAPEGLRLAALEDGVRDTIHRLARAVQCFRADTNATALSDNFAQKAEIAARRQADVMPDPARTTQTLLSIAEGAGQASTPVRAAAFSVCMAVGGSLRQVTGFTPDAVQSARIDALQKQFPQMPLAHKAEGPRGLAL